MEGKVINLDGTPLFNVEVTLRGVSPSGPMEYVVHTGWEGLFLFDKVVPGRYELSAEKPGFLREYYTAQGGAMNYTPLTIAKGQVVKGLVRKLTEEGVISGKVTDESGNPMKGLAVTALRLGYRGGKRVLIVAGWTLSDDQGHYRVEHLIPGRYHVVAHPKGTSSEFEWIAHADVPSGPMPKKAEETHVNTYYPDSPDLQGAAEIQVQSGSERSGVDVTFQKTFAFRVRGQVVDGPTGQPVQEARVALLRPVSRGMTNMSGLGGPPVIGGKFEITGVIPGTYVLVAAVTKNNQTLYARQTVYVVDQNLTGLLIRIPSPVDVSGQVQVTGGSLQNPPSEALRMENVDITLFPANGFGVGTLPQATAQADGSFVLHNVEPDKFHVEVRGMPPGWYVKSILMGGQECADGIVNLGSGGGSIEIDLGRGAGEVVGYVVGADDRLAPGVKVTMVPKDEAKQGRWDLYRVAVSDQRGQFQIKDVVPGMYEIFAWRGLESGDIMDPEFHHHFETKATFVNVNENGHESVTLRVIP